VSVRPTAFFHSVLTSVAFHRGAHHGEGAEESCTGATMAGTGVGVDEERVDGP
jgi:hypothetical protein